MPKDRGLSDEREYVIQIYRAPMEIGFPVQGEARFSEEIAFLDKLAGWPSSGSGRFVPDSADGYYVLTDEQFDRYLSFRKERSAKS